MGPVSLAFPELHLTERLRNKQRVRCAKSYRWIALDATFQNQPENIGSSDAHLYLHNSSAAVARSAPDRKRSLGKPEVEHFHHVAKFERMIDMRATRAQRTAREKRVETDAQARP